MSYDLTRKERLNFILEGYSKGEFGIHDWISFARAVRDTYRKKDLLRGIELFENILNSDDAELRAIKEKLPIMNSDVRRIGLFLAAAMKAFGIQDDLEEIRRLHKDLYIGS